MLKYFLFLVGIFVSFPLYAMEEDEDMNVVIFSAQEKKSKQNINLPTCDEQAMIDIVSDQIREYQETNPVYGIINRRKQILLLKNLNHFQEIDVVGFDNHKNSEVARQILMNKINYNISEEHMRLCCSSSGLYLLIYPEGNGYRVQILNLKQLRYGKEEMSVFYARAEDGKKDNIADDLSIKNKDIEMVENQQVTEENSPQTAEKGIVQDIKNQAE